MRDYSFEITKRRYDYMFPVFGHKRLLSRGNKYYFIGNNEDYLDFLNRCKYE